MGTVHFLDRALYSFGYLDGKLLVAFRASSSFRYFYY